MHSMIQTISGKVFGLYWKILPKIDSLFMLHWTARCILKSFLTVNMVWNKLFILSHNSSNLLFMYLEVFKGHSISQQKFPKILKIWMYSLKVMTKNYFKVKTRLQNHWNRHQNWKLFRALLDFDNWFWCLYGYIVPCFSKSCSPKRFLRFFGGSLIKRSWIKYSD